MLQGILRESISKSGSKALRRDGYLIANVYAKGVENINCAFKKNEFIKAVRNKEGLFLEVEVAGKSYKTVVQEYQTDPVTNDLLHVDLKIAVSGVVSQYFIPVITTGVAKGLRNKGVLVTSRKRVKVKGTPESLPSNYELNVTDLDVGDNILIRDLPAVSGVTILEKDSVPVVGVIKAK